MATSLAARKPSLTPALGAPATLELVARCRLCDARLDQARGDLLDVKVCHECKDRPEARRLGLPPSAGNLRLPVPARDLTAADKSLIQKMQGFVPAAQLLAILNERLASDLGPDAAPYTMDQLRAELLDQMDPAGATDWAGLRQLLAQARRSGVLAAVTAQVIDDFAIVFSLTAAQVLQLKDVLLDKQRSDQHSEGVQS